MNNRVLVFTRIDMESVLNKRATRFDEVNIVQRRNQISPGSKKTMDGT